jgi:hypothetical protein
MAALTYCDDNLFLLGKQTVFFFVVDKNVPYVCDPFHHHIFWSRGCVLLTYFCSHTHTHTQNLIFVLVAFSSKALAFKDEPPLPKC